MNDDVIVNDGEIKSDEFSVSINSIVLLNKPTTVPGLMKILDDNGYFGRYKVLRKVTKKYGETIISIEVYLPNSNANYIWPFRTLYNLTIGSLVKKIKLRKIPAIKYIMRYLANGCHFKGKFEITSIDELPVKLMKDNYSNDLSYYQYMVTTLVHAGLLVIDKKNKKIIFRLKDDKDIEEVCSNLFNPDNYLD